MKFSLFQQFHRDSLIFSKIYFQLSSNAVIEVLVDQYRKTIHDYLFIIVINGVIQTHTQLEPGISATSGGHLPHSGIRSIELLDELPELLYGKRRYFHRSPTWTVRSGR